MTHFKAKVDKAFIIQRDEKINEDNRPNPYFRWDSEFVEFHQAKVDQFQTLYDGYEYDTYHQMLGSIDYKMYSKSGVHVSEYIQKQIRNGRIDKLGIWMWSRPWPGPLEENQVVEYKILDYIDAKDALKHINKNNRFTYPLEYDRI